MNRVRPRKRVPLLAQDPVLPAQTGQLGPLVGREAVPSAGVDVGLADPRPHGGLGQIQVPGHLADGAVTPLAQLDDLSLELRREGTHRSETRADYHGE